MLASGGMTRVQPKPWNVTTSFFSHFPPAFGEKDIGRKFSRWGMMHEVFIARKFNRWGHKFGFVQFYDARNAKKLEQELNSIMIGVMKLRVNFICMPEIVTKGC